MVGTNLIGGHNLPSLVGIGLLGKFPMSLICSGMPDSVVLVPTAKIYDECLLSSSPVFSKGTSMYYVITNVLSYFYLKQKLEIVFALFWKV